MLSLTRTILRAGRAILSAGRRVCCRFTAVSVFAAIANAHAQPAAPPSAERAVSVPAISGVVDAGARWSLAWHGTNNADGLVALPDGSVLFAQEQPRLVARLDASDRYSIWLEDTNGVGSLAFDAAGRLWGVERSCTDPGRRDPAPCTASTAIARLTPTRAVLADSVDGRPLGRLNDLVVGSDGAVWFTSGGAWRASADGTVSPVGQDIQANGIALSLDESRVFVTNGETVVAVDIGSGGNLADARAFALLEAGGRGDGMAVDAMGRLYVTSAPGVQVFDEDGAFLGLIPTPRPAISVAFAGPDRRTLYVVGSGAALGPGGGEYLTPEGVRNNAKSIYRLPMLAAGAPNRGK